MSPTRKPHPSGRDTEQQALAWLTHQGLKPIQQNFNCRSGEVDLIGVDRDTLAFIEIRYRGNSSFSSAAESIDRRKQRKLIAAAQYFLHTHPAYNNMPCRFDAVLSDHLDNDEKFVFQWCKNAFTLEQ